MNWSTYNDVYDLFINGKFIKRIWGRKKSIRLAESQSGGLFGGVDIDLVNIHTGEIIYLRKRGGT